MAGAEDVYYLHTERFHIEGEADRAHVEQNLQSVFLDELLRKARRDLLVLCVNEHETEQLEHLQLKARACLRVRQAQGDVADDLQNIVGDGSSTGRALVVVQ